MADDVGEDGKPSVQLHLLRNTSTLLTIGSKRLLIDPMLSRSGTLPGFRLVGGPKRKNPLVELPARAMDVISQATEVVITHEHPDHLDRPAIDWIKQRGLPVWCSGVDVANLRRKGLDARVFNSSGLGFDVEEIPATHGRGLLGYLMGPVSGFYFADPDEPSLYWTGDSVLTETVKMAIQRLRPDVIVAPAGAANFGFGRDIIFSLQEQVELAKLTSKQVVFNHLEAIDHCPMTRRQLRETMNQQGVGQRVTIPADGECVTFERDSTEPHAPVSNKPPRRPGFQKWLTAKFSGT